MKEDIRKNGVKVELHILPDKTVICGHQRLQIAKELGIEHLRCKTVHGLDSPDSVEEYVIKDNLLRRHMSTEQKYIMIARLSKMYEIGRRGRTKEERIEEVTVTSSNKDVLDKTSDELGVSPATIRNARSYVHAIEEYPDLKGEKISKVKSEYRKQKDKEKKNELGKNITISNKNIDIRLGNFLDVLQDIPDGSIDLILTDPPYGIEFIDCWQNLASFAKQKLKPNRFCIAYSGQKNIYEVMTRMNKCLDYYWEGALIHNGFTQTLSFNKVSVKWKPILFYQNGFKKHDNRIIDVIEGTGREKKNHKWAQAMDEIKPIIETFTSKNDLIVDPFAGSGTTLLISNKLGRRCIGAEIDEQYFNIAKKRIADGMLE